METYVIINKEGKQVEIHANSVKIEDGILLFFHGDEIVASFNDFQQFENKRLTYDDAAIRSEFVSRTDNHELIYTLLNKSGIRNHKWDDQIGEFKVHSFIFEEDIVTITVSKDSYERMSNAIKGDC